MAHVEERRGDGCVTDEIARVPVGLRSGAIALDRPDATQVGVLLAATGAGDIADARVVICARRSAQAIVTNDPDDLQRLDPRAVQIAF